MHIKKKRPHFEWVEHHLKRGWELTGARVLIAATLRHDIEYRPGVFKLVLWRVASKENAYTTPYDPRDWSFPEIPIEYH